MDAKKACDTREMIIRLLNEISSCDGDRKKAAKGTIEALKLQDKFVGIHLTEIVLYRSGELAIRLLASEHLVNYTETQLCSRGRYFGPLDTKAKLKIKEKMMKLLIVGLKEPIDEIRNAVAYVLGTIATSNWPTNWDNIADALLHCLDEENELVTDGAMHALRECICHVDCSLLDVAGQFILQKIYQIFENENKYSARVRGQSIEMLKTIVNMSGTDFSQRYLHSMIPNFCQKIIYYLSADNDFGQNYGLKTSIVETVTTLTKMLPKCISDFFPQILSLIWKTLVDSAKVYHEKGLTGSRGETMNDFHKSVRAILYFTDSLMRMSCVEGHEYSLSTYHCHYLQGSLSPEVLHHFIILLQVTDEKIELWSDDSSKFYTDEAMLQYPNCLRGEVQEYLIMENIVRFPERPAANTLVVVILKHLETEYNMRVSHSSEVGQNGWKLHEAFLSAFCLARNIIVQKLNEGSLHFDIVVFLKIVVLADLNDLESHPLLIARCLCLGGLYAELMQPEMASSFFENTIKGLQNKCFCVKICALIAARHWLRSTAVEGNYVLKETLIPHIPALFQELFNIGSKPSSLDITELVMRNVYLLALFHRGFTPTVESKIYTLIATACTQFGANTHIDHVSKYYIKQFTLNPKFRSPIQGYLIPVLTDKTFDILDILVQHSPLPLSSLLIENAFPAACRYILDSNCFKTLKDGGKVICTYFSKAAEQVIGYRDEQGNTGRRYISQVAAYLLKPNFPNSVALVACEIVILLITETRNTPLADVPEIEKLLSAVFRRMRIEWTERSSVHRFLLVWAHFINTRTDAAFDLLFGIPSCVEFVFNELCRKYVCFNHHDRKTTVTPALCKILEHGLTHHESQLHHIIFEETAEGQTKTIPILMKIFKLITPELSEV